MEQLTVTTEGTVLSGSVHQGQHAGRLIELAMLSKKVKLRLSREQLSVVSKIMGIYLTGAKLWGIDDKVIYYLVWEIYEGKIRKKMLDLKPEVSLSMNLPHAWGLMNMFYTLDLSGWPYEETIANWIISEIDHQTA